MEALTLEQSTVHPYVQVIILLHCSSENSIVHSLMSQFKFQNGNINIRTEYCESTRSSCCSTSSTKSRCLVHNALLGPFVLREMSQQTVMAARRRRMLRTYWFMQNGARPHRTAEVFDFLQATFRDRIVALDTLAFTVHGVE